MGNSHVIRDHTVLPATRQRWESRLYPQPKEVLDLSTLEGCKAELTYVYKKCMLHSWSQSQGWNMPVCKKRIYRRQTSSCQPAALHSTVTDLHRCRDVDSSGGTKQEIAEHVSKQTVFVLTFLGLLYNFDVFSTALNILRFSTLNSCEVVDCIMTVSEPI